MKKIAKSIFLQCLKLYGLLVNIIPFEKQTKDRILVLKVDAIGDYILLRNYLAEIKNSDKFRDKELVLLGNILWRELAETLDNQVVDEFIWLDLDKKKQSKWYFIKFLAKISKYNFTDAIYPTYSRDSIIGDFLMSIIRAKYKITYAGDLNNMSYTEKIKGDKIYTQLIETTPTITFEYLRNKEFFSCLLDKQLNPKFELKPVPSRLHNLFMDNIVFCVSAGAKKRKWALGNFLTLAKWLNNEFNKHIVLCGDKIDIAEYSQVNQEQYSYITNLVGQTNLIELIDILSQAKFILSNETSIPHMSIALDKMTFVISNGNHFGRFSPYPSSITTKYYAIYPPEIMDNLVNYAKLCKRFEFSSELNINLVSVAMVKNMIKKVINV